MLLQEDDNSSSSEEPTVSEAIVIPSDPLSDEILLPGPVKMPKPVPKHIEEFRRLREEQDREYETSLAIDRAKVCLFSTFSYN